MRGVFINIEGPDASGKATQARKLCGRLEDEGYEVYFQDFPAYEQTEAGKELYEYLHSDEELPLHEEAMLFIDDRYALKEELEHALEAGKVVVTDRYAQSNWAYQTTDMATADRWTFIDWMKQQEADLPQPDLVLYMDMPVEQSLVLLDNRDTRDRNENREKLEKVVAAYREIAAEEDWIVIPPMIREWYDTDHEVQGTRFLRDPADIFDAGPDADQPSVWQAVKPVLD